MLRDATFNGDYTKRFDLIRDWTPPGVQPRTLLLMGLNPSIAGKLKDDPTIRKGIGFATRWGCSRLVMCNAIATVSTDPRALPQWSGFDAENHLYLLRWLKVADLIVAAWGGVPRGISDTTRLPLHLDWIYTATDRDIHCIGLTRSGAPLHPSRAAYTSAPLIYRAAVS